VRGRPKLRSRFSPLAWPSRYLTHNEGGEVRGREVGVRGREGGREGERRKRGRERWNIPSWSYCWVGMPCCDMCIPACIAIIFATN